jgi:hypothetical protein
MGSVFFLFFKAGYGGRIGSEKRYTILQIKASHNLHFIMVGGFFHMAANDGPKMFSKPLAIVNQYSARLLHEIENLAQSLNK